MSVSSSISEDTVNQFSNFHLKDYDYPHSREIYKNPPNHLKHKEWVQTDQQHDSFVFREVQRCLSEAIIEHLDYDLYHVSYLLSVKNQPADLKTSLQSTIAGLQYPNPAPTVSSHQRLLEMAKYLLGVIEEYEKKKNQNKSSLEIKRVSMKHGRGHSLNVQ
ncbi:hypothetical protein DFH28DRAFT_1089623 [Melampsora americana]|nr:hypothetical protein DFH28DRAFT_1089623 [Melampsora americana]